MMLIITILVSIVVTNANTMEKRFSRTAKLNNCKKDCTGKYHDLCLQVSGHIRAYYWCLSLNRQCESKCKAMAFDNKDLENNDMLFFSEVNENNDGQEENEEGELFEINGDYADDDGGKPERNGLHGYRDLKEKRKALLGLIMRNERGELKDKEMALFRFMKNNRDDDLKEKNKFLFGSITSDSEDDELNDKAEALLEFIMDDGDDDLKQEKKSLLAFMRRNERDDSKDKVKALFAFNKNKDADELFNIIASNKDVEIDGLLFRKDNESDDIGFSKVSEDNDLY